MRSGHAGLVALAVGIALAAACGRGGPSEGVAPSAPAAPSTEAAQEAPEPAEEPGAPTEAAAALPAWSPVVHPAARSPYARLATPPLEEARGRLRRVVRAHGLDPAIPWALTHALLALGPDVALPDGRLALDALFDAAELTPAGGIRFPSSRDGVPVEPHYGLVLKGLSDLGVPGDRQVTVQGETLPVDRVGAAVLAETWVDGGRSSRPSDNDLPWALHGLTSRAPGDLSWTVDGHTTSLDGFTHHVVRTLAASTSFLAEARSKGAPFQKQKQGIFAFTCAGAHLLQGAMHAVAHGFGEEGDREAVVEQIALQRWRYPRELQQLDAVRQKYPEHAVLLGVQRLKQVGHHVETMHRAALLGLVPAGDAVFERELRQAEDHLVETVAQLHAARVFDEVAAVRASNEQTFLDLVGDGAHALKALDLATGVAALPAPEAP